MRSAASRAVLARVRVPASTANLGPGYDALAAGVDLGLEVTAQHAGGAPRVTTTGEGADELPTDGTNLVWRAVEAYCAHVDAPPPDVALEVTNPIPLERGLGSSSAAAVAGLVLARELVGRPVDDRDLLRLAVAFEGHPDNAAAALHGGLVVCLGTEVLRLVPSDALQPVLLVPTSRQSTAAARQVLPEHVSLRTAAANGARTAAVVAGLTGLVPLTPAAMVDELHEPPRFEVMPATGGLVEDLRAAGIAACLSGAGPSALAVIANGDRAALDVIAERAGTAFEVRPSGWSRGGATALPPDQGRPVEP